MSTVNHDITTMERNILYWVDCPVSGFDTVNIHIYILNINCENTTQREY